MEHPLGTKFCLMCTARIHLFVAHGNIKMILGCWRSYPHFTDDLSESPQRIHIKDHTVDRRGTI